MDILSPEQLEALINSSAKNELKRAVKLLFKKGDIIEVRAWDKNHAVFTGRYNYGTKLIDVLEIFDEEGCDCYYVLNPVGDKHGLRDMSSGGLCTWENDVPFRRRFLLDFDPKRENKIATDYQWDDAYNTAVRAMAWLESYGYKGIILASSGNGCHLLVPCNLPNDPASKELVRKVQRAVSEKFSTATVECECFPDANRLVRAYGSTNKKGTPTEGMPHRLSGILRMPDGEDDDPKGIMEAIVKDNPIADAKTHNLGTGTGPFSRDLLYARLEAWQEGWKGTDGDSFMFEETDRRDGFRVQCPGSLTEGWPDGECHGDQSTSLNDSCIVYVENGWPRFSCRHNHCGEGAEHGKKTWKDLQEFYDKERKLHRIMDETDYAAVWNIDYVDDGAPDAGEADVETLSVDVFEDGITTVEFEKPERSNGTPLTETSVVTVGVTVVDKVAEGTKPRKLVMPESCMYGWLGWAAKELETPLGFAYPAMLTAAASLIKTYPRHIRPTLYCCLIGGVHCGKSETIKRAVGYKNQTGILSMPVDAVKWTVPGSDRGLIKIFQQDKDDKTLVESMLVPTFLLAQDELRNTLAKVGIQNSALPSVLCSAWEQDEVGTADKTGKHSADMHLNILGALKADDAEDFADVFSKETTSGLYDRFIFGLAPKGWEFDTWERPVNVRYPKSCSIPKHCWTMMKEWRAVEPIGRGRLGEIAMRVAYITSAMNHDAEMTEEAMRAALAFCEWQEWIRTTYKAGLGDSDDAKCTAAILGVLEKLEPGMWIRWRELAAKKNWYKKFSARTLSATRDALHKSGFTIEEVVEDEDGKPKRTGRLRLRVGTDDAGAKPVVDDEPEAGPKVTLKGKVYTKVQTEQMKGKEEPGAKYMSID